MGRRYTDTEAGRWYKTNLREFKFVCCDCGLVHTINFKIRERPRRHRLLMQVFRDNRATGQVRRWDKKRKKP